MTAGRMTRGRLPLGKRDRFWCGFRRWRMHLGAAIRAARCPHPRSELDLCTTLGASGHHRLGHAPCCPGLSDRLNPFFDSEQGCRSAIGEKPSILGDPEPASVSMESALFKQGLRPTGALWGEWIEPQHSLSVAEIEPVADPKAKH